jgi:hypothetical protein
MVTVSIDAEDRLAIPPDERTEMDMRSHVGGDG